MKGNKITFGETTVEIPPLDYTRCKHAVTTLDDDAKMLYCRRCGKHISGYEFIRHHLVDLAFLFKRIKEAKSQMNMKFKQVESLRKEEARIRGRIRRLKSRNPERQEDE